MPNCVIFGGAGFVGTHLAKHFLKTKKFDHIHIADIRKSPLQNDHRISTSSADVREKIDIPLVDESPTWIFNLAAIHREPGHNGEEYYETNIKGAHNVCEYAENVNCQNIYFTSSIAIYGPCINPTSECKLPMPITPYGSSKYPAELIHQNWLNRDHNRRLVISRPGVIYGPGDPGNIMRMIKAIRKGYFAFPGSRNIHKSYAYIYGFIDSIDFTMDSAERLIIYNYVEKPTETIEEVSNTVKKVFNSKAPIVSVPAQMLVPISHILQKLIKNNNPIHPVRVKKAGTPTHIVPQTLSDMGFAFKYNFEKSIKHWMEICPEDFE